MSRSPGDLRIVLTALAVALSFAIAPSARAGMAIAPYAGTTTANGTQASIVGGDIGLSGGILDLMFHAGCLANSFPCGGTNPVGEYGGLVNVGLTRPDSNRGFAGVGLEIAGLSATNSSGTEFSVDAWYKYPILQARAANNQGPYPDEILWLMPRLGYRSGSLSASSGGGSASVAGPYLALELFVYLNP